MDRNTVIGFTLMFLIMMGWFVYMTPSQEEVERMREERRIQDSIRTALADQVPLTEEISRRDRPGAGVPSGADAINGRDPQTDSDIPASARMGVFGESAITDTLYYVIETPIYTAVFTNLGAGPVSFTLHEYDRWDGTPVQLIADSIRSAYSLGFVSIQNYNIETAEILFRQANTGGSVRIDQGQEHRLRYVLEIEDGNRLVYEYHFNAENYDITLDILFDGAQQYISDRNVEFAWQSRLNPTERSISSESEYMAAFVFSGGVLEKHEQSSPGRNESIITGAVDWVSTKTKFFTQIIKPETPGTGAIITSSLIGDPSSEEAEYHFTSTVRTRIPSENVLRFNLYLGPLEYYTIREFDRTAYDMVDVGYRFTNWFAEPLVKYVILPVITTLGDLTGNYGFAIIIFAFLIKIVLYPLTKKSFESMAAMRELQPEMKAIQEKYKEDPKKQQEATLKLFKKAKVNPLGGCLPNLLQLPILITLWRFFQNAIEIRGESFLWADDLSAPDIILQLPFTIPFMGDFIAGFVLLMTASMIVQFKVSGQGGAANPQMKILQYIFPVMLLLIFNRLSSGLSLYYLIYNVLSIGQQFMINKKIDHVKMMEGIDKKKAKELAKEQARTEVSERKTKAAARKSKKAADDDED